MDGPHPERAGGQGPLGPSGLVLIEVAAGLVFREGKLLIAQRRPNDHLGGLWEFPGGKREPGESFEACLRRELMEELGIDVRPEELLEEVTHTYPEKTVYLRFHRCVWLAGDARPLACHALAWITRDELVKYQFPAADERLLELLRARPDWWGLAV